MKILQYRNTVRLYVVTVRLVTAKLSGFLRLIRPANCLMMGFAVLVGASLAKESMFSQEVSMRLLLGFLTAFTLTGASMAVNDYYDREIDRINAPNHPIPSGLIKPEDALVFAIILAVIGVIAASLINTLCLLTAVVSWIISVVYATSGKRTGLLGNFLVSTCVAIPFIYGSIVVVGTVKSNVLIFASMAFLSNTGREITKGIVDVPGDRVKGVRTVAVSYGERIAAFVATLLYLVAVFLSGLPVMFGLVSFWFIPPVVVADVGFIVSSIWLVCEPTRENARRVKNLVLVWMMMGLISFILGSI